jgi:hypothetical protein
MAAKEVTAKRRTSAKRRPPAKKAAPSKASSKTGAKNKPRTAAKPPVKAAAKKAAPAKRAAAKKAPAKKAPVKKTTSNRGGFKRELDEHGFVPGTDSAHIAAALLAGGKDRNEINEKVLKKIGGETRTGSTKNIPALVSGVLNRLLEQGYKVESSWTLVAPARKRRVAKK